MSKENQASESPPSPSRCYATEVKEAVGKLLDLTLAGKFHTLSMDTDEDSAWVNLWYRGRMIKVSAFPMGGIEGWISPEENDEGDYWSFLECCQRALAEAEKLA